MASGLPSGIGGGGGGGGGGFYINPTTSFGGGSSILQYRQQQQQQIQNEQFPSIPPRRNMTNFVGKRSISELEKLQQQQQQGILYRSVKQRNHYNHTSPISPLTPFDFSTGNNSSSSSSSAHLLPHLQQLRSFSSNNNNNNNNPSFSNRVMSLEKEFESEKKMKNKLQELEKQLLDDDDDDDEEDNDVVSFITSNEWSETMHNLITPNHQISNKKPPFSPSSSSGSSSSSSSSSPQISSFIDIATAISVGNLDIATTKLDQISNIHGDSSEQRLIAYMVSALRSRLNQSENHSSELLFQNNHIIATQMLYEASPCFKLSFMAANLSILEATKDEPNNIHVIDFDIGQGNQYISLIHSIGERQQQSKTRKPQPFTTITITSVLLLLQHHHSEIENQNQKIVGDRLKEVADLVGIGLKFNIVICKTISSLNLGCDDDEEVALVVNFAFKLYKLSDESVSTENPRDELLRLVKSLKPRVVTMVEQEMNSNTAPFVARVAEVSSYYLALFNSLDSTLGSERVKMIQECLGRKAINSVTCEGKERVERCELFGKWRARMRMAGFVIRPLGEHVADSMKAKLNSVYRNNNPGFTVKEEADGICFGWNDRVLTVASAWY